ncbi:MAG: hypothetical protein Q8941_04155 [Bacteroidota bacterium]|nr:hypothetical protein [Bacteroidota bacterium]
MKLVFFLFIFFYFIATACHHPGIASGVPKCIYKEISTNSKNPDWMTGVIKEYLFQNKIVYAFEPDTRKIADGATTIKDADCNTLCNVGGFGGLAIDQCNGDNFFKTAVYKRTIWEKK